ncbi:MAG TPA: hypothetical protein VNM92_13960 [Thermoanaerobaculia bacterium]|nr:hypothetical protein [Thermoanaerobaculia bacterium]
MNTRFEYVYRDASNYKKWREIIFAGRASEGLAHRLTAALHDGEWFIAEQVRLPNLFLLEFSVNEDDHCWHEFHSLTQTKNVADDAYARTIDEFVTEVERVRVKGWKEFARPT